MQKEDLIMIVLIVGLIGLCFGGVVWVSKKSCLASYENQKPSWGIWTGCRITINGVLTPTDIVRELK